jgi:hypothetical protein
MKTMHAGMVAVTLLSAAIPLALTHCSSSNATTAADGGHTGNSGSGSSGGASGGSGDEADAGTGNGSSGSASGGDGGGGGGASVDGAAGGNADGGASSGGMMAVTCQAPDGGAACDPGVVPCGSTTCDTSQTSCCHAMGDAGTDTCVGPNGACTGTLERCNETSDCASGLVCCDNYGATSCAASCGPYAYQICRSDTECGLDGDAGAAAKRCIVQTCGGPTPGGGPSTPAVTIEACAVPSYAGMGMQSTWGPIYGCTAK